MRDIQLVLERWGGWAAQEGTQVNWPPIAGRFKGLLPQVGKSRESCCDNDGLIVDAAVGMLKKAGRDDELDMVMLHYVYGTSKSALARGLKCSEGKV